MVLLLGRVHGNKAIDPRRHIYDEGNPAAIDGLATR